MSEKTNWPELVGTDGETASATIKQENPNVNTQIMPEGSMCTMDYCTDRVRIFVDSSNNVVRPPHVG